MMLVDLLVKLAVHLVKGLWRAVNVKRKAPDEIHTTDEYLDAVLFADDSPKPSDQSRPSSIRTEDRG
jgi:hypothetical protein